MTEEITEETIVAIAIALILNEQEGLGPQGRIDYLTRNDLQNFTDIPLDDLEDESNE